MDDGGITVVLPEDLAWTYANRASGDSGGQYARPVGIRLTPNKLKEIYRNQEEALNEIFASVESLKDFILSSDCDGADHLKEKLKKKALEQPEPLISNSQELFEMAVIRLALANKDNELIRMVLQGSFDKYFGVTPAIKTFAVDSQKPHWFL
jgi:hypothetical protein